VRPAVFLDRDGVLIDDVDLLVRPEQIRILGGVPEALRALAGAGYALVVVTNQPVVARGVATERDVEAVHDELARRLTRSDAPPLDGVYVCPHHPDATLAGYRTDCDCRKPRPGLLVRAARELDLDLASSYLVGDRPSDIAAGASVGCTTVLVRSGRHAERPIVSSAPLEPPPVPDHACDDLAAAADWILSRR
jgi:D-glycero-D-manno-heptose 1,7-bisphosphate phosphatase